MRKPFAKVDKSSIIVDTFLYRGLLGWIPASESVLP